MTTSAFPPATPLLNLLATARRRLADVTTADLIRAGRQTLSITITCLVFAGAVLLAIAQRLHTALKGLIILLRVVADLLEHTDDWIEQLKLDNQPQTAPVQAAPTVPTTAIHPLAQLAEDLLGNTTAELRSITGIRKRSKRAMVDQYLSV